MNTQTLLRATPIALAWVTWMGSPAMALANDQEPSTQTDVEETTQRTDESRTTTTDEGDVRTEERRVERTDLYRAPEPVYPTPQRTVNPHIFTDVGMSLGVGGGVNNFTNSVLRDMADVGGNWDAKLTIGTRQIVAFEAGYVGTAQGIQALGLDNSAVLMSNGVQGDVRVNLTTGDVQPYIFGGAAYKHYSLMNSSINTSDVRDSDDVIEIPAGIGLAWHVGAFVAEPRFDYRWAFGDQLVNSFDSDGNRVSGLDNWNLSANVGFEF